jgi:dTDP-glucose 4,6-dehydratase
MRMLVTGAAGFIGSHLVDRLLADGHEVVGVDNLCTGDRRNLAHVAPDAPFAFVEADVCDDLLTEKELDGALDGALDGVFHLASPASPVDYHRLPIETLRAGSEGTRRVLELARERGSRTLVASTSEVYGDPETHPQAESYRGNVNPVGPRSVYDEAKRFGEALAAAYAREGLADVRIARIFNTYGPRMRLSDGRALPEFCRSALRGDALPVFGDGSQTRSFCYVTDLVDGLVRLWAADMPFGPDWGPVNLGNPDEVTVLEFAREVIEAAASKSGIAFRPLPQDDPRRRCPDITRARELLGWEPAVNRADGLRLTVEDVRGRVAAS